ncbi:hypothetical protein IWC96_09995 [Brevundimonas sp. BAL450]|uniref:hypothetical protein n=1 Tax=Brevundimonas sp. BAL450 TaxID=1708162 RepID=UPI0018C9E8BD|nr:hypothetical protein [Brevundimonas sp. BAL450]MBG7615609.1 hypothetical protein [Brevundimonas sp. BAL450]
MVRVRAAIQVFEKLRREPWKERQEITTLGEFNDRKSNIGKRKKGIFEQSPVDQGSDEITAGSLRK